MAPTHESLLLDYEWKNFVKRAPVLLKHWVSLLDVLSNRTSVNRMATNWAMAMCSETSTKRWQWSVFRWRQRGLVFSHSEYVRSNQSVEECVHTRQQNRRRSGESRRILLSLCDWGLLVTKECRFLRVPDKKLSPNRNSLAHILSQYDKWMISVQFKVKKQTNNKKETKFMSRHFFLWQHIPVKNIPLTRTSITTVAAQILHKENVR